ncbi:hypothetical protein ADL29_04495 [Streptomyces chattanoogensis]|uniref:Uncharacterized protein n=1 Tax=Streptomyces chattanoogensis TaxID=66876 RepID=A0A0N1JZP9_9ACTN|nr:hypothetical protein ADL29_04495 [Streptomyces chattanoogensis]
MTTKGRAVRQVAAGAYGDLQLDLPRDCPECAVLREQLSEVLQAQDNPASGEVFAIMGTRKEYGCPEDTRSPQ